MIDFFLGIFSTMFQMNMRDHHDMPFAMPLMMACIVGGLVGFIIVKYVVKEQQEDIDPVKPDSIRKLIND